MFDKPRTRMFSLYYVSVHTKFNMVDHDSRTYFYVPRFSAIEPPPGFSLSMDDLRKQATVVTNKNLKIDN